MSIVRRMLRAAKLDAGLYEEVEADQKATGQAMLIVIMGALATGIGSLTEGGWLGLVIGTVVGLIGWAIWAWLNYFLGTRLLKEAQTEANWGQLARTMGFAYTPRLLAIFSLIPIPLLRALIFVAVTVWSWIAMVIAVRQALDYKSTLRAVAVTTLGFLVNIAILIVVQVILIEPIRNLLS
ncbi:MAG: YIP1 family protein [Dehalococcoidia bacterium]|nr:YIP1 family protein [Dehalococcoidia bacterium]